MNRTPQNYGSISNAMEGYSDSNSVSFINLTDNVVTNIYTINASLKTLENALKTIGTNKDNQGLRNNIHVTQLSTNQIASVTTKDLNKLKSITPKTDKKRQFQVEKLEGNFKDAISRYYGLQKEVASKQKSNLLPVAAVEENNFEENDSEQQRQAQLSREMAFEQDMLIERESRVKQIESDILDINQIMRELGSLVHSQGETIDTIENCIDHTVGNIEQGTDHIIKASRYQTRHRKKLCILILIALIVAAILITIIVVELKK